MRSSQCGSDTLVHVVVTVLGQPAHERYVALLKGECLIPLEQGFVLRPGNRIVGQELGKESIGKFCSIWA